MGFGVPLDAWFRGELRDYVRDTLLAPTRAAAAYVAGRTVRTARAGDHQRGHANLGQQPVGLVCFERWLQLLPAWTACRATCAVPC